MTDLFSLDVHGISTRPPRTFPAIVYPVFRHPCPRLADVNVNVNNLLIISAYG